MKKHWKTWLIIGVICIVIGVVAGIYYLKSFGISDDNGEKNDIKEITLDCKAGLEMFMSEKIGEANINNKYGESVWHNYTGFLAFYSPKENGCTVAYEYHINGGAARYWHTSYNIESLSSQKVASFSYNKSNGPFDEGCYSEFRNKNFKKCSYDIMKSLREEEIEYLKGEYNLERKGEPIDIEGKQTYYYENGQIKAKLNYKGGKQEGKQTYYYDNGQIKEKGNYKDGLKEGEQIVYYENEQIKSILNYKDGKQEGKQIRYYENGQVKCKGTYTGNLKSDGERIYYYENGQIERKNYYKDWKIDGEQLYYYENGQLKWKQPFNNGKRNGKWEYYDKEGNLTKIETYENGELINSEQF